MIKINDVKYSYENSETEALRGVSISIADGEFVAIVGHNGSGKSTLAKMLNALAAAVVRQRDCVRNGHGG